MDVPVNGGECTALAPVIPLFSGSPPLDDAHAAEQEGDGGNAAGAQIERDIAEKRLIKKLGARSLSVREARSVLAGSDLDSATLDEIEAEFVDRGYLDDTALAEQLIRSGLQRKGQGRRAIAQILAKRGIPRTIADTVLSALPDDDFERALSFAQSRVGSLRGAPADAALRRLTGQLSRRGYPGSVALSAARAALHDGPAAR